jgi:nitroreductase
MQQPVIDARALETMLSAAVAAPSIHNTQPWRFRFDAETRTIEVHAVPDRSLPLADPTTRALHISVGAAVFNLQVAVAHLGWEPVVRLLPTGQPDLLAVVRLAGPPHGGTIRPELYSALWRRHSSRLPFSPEPVPSAVLGEVAEAARIHGMELSVPDAWGASQLLAVTREAEHRNTDDPARYEESLAWITDGERSDGIPEYALGPQDSADHVPVRSFSGPRSDHPVLISRFEEHPQLVLLATRHDNRSDWLRTGQAMEHVLLLLTAHGLRASLMYQAIEWPDLRWLLRDPLAGLSVPQMLLRVGYGPEGPPTPRRSVAETLGES